MDRMTTCIRPTGKVQIGTSTLVFSPNLVSLVGTGRFYRSGEEVLPRFPTIVDRGYP